MYLKGIVNFTRLHNYCILLFLSFNRFKKKRRFSIRLHFCVFVTRLAYRCQGIFLVQTVTSVVVSLKFASKGDKYGMNPFYWFSPTKFVHTYKQGVQWFYYKFIILSCLFILKLNAIRKCCFNMKSFFPFWLIG